MDRLRPEHEIDEGRALEDALALLARDAAAHSDDELRAAKLEQPPLAQVGKNLLLRLLADRTGIEEDDVGLFRVGRDFETVGLAEDVRHPRRVVFVHLAAEGGYVQSAAHVSGRRSNAKRAPRVPVLGFPMKRFSAGTGNL